MASSSLPLHSSLRGCRLANPLHRRLLNSCEEFFTDQLQQQRALLGSEVARASLGQQGWDQHMSMLRQHLISLPPPAAPSAAWRKASTQRGRGHPLLPPPGLHRARPAQHIPVTPTGATHFTTLDTGSPMGQPKPEAPQSAFTDLQGWSCLILDRESC